MIEAAIPLASRIAGLQRDSTIHDDAQAMTKRARRASADWYFLMTALHMTRLNRSLVGTLALILTSGYGFAAEATAGVSAEQEGLAKVAEIWQLEIKGERIRELEFARELAASHGPEWIKAWARGAASRLTSVGSPLEMEFTALDGRTHRLTAMKGKVVLIDFWATWCAPCVAATPKLKELYSRYHAKGFEIFGVSWDDDESALKEFLQRKQIPWPQCFEGKRPGKWGEAFGIGGVPYAILVDKSGNVQVFGAAIEEQELENRIGALLEM